MVVDAGDQLLGESIQVKGAHRDVGHVWVTLIELDDLLHRVRDGGTAFLVAEHQLGGAQRFVQLQGPPLSGVISAALAGQLGSTGGPDGVADAPPEPVVRGGVAQFARGP